MMYDYADYTGDVDFLRNIAFDFMQGAFNVYYAMMEEVDGRLSMPVTISPEYRGSDTNAWGADASFQLAACHRLVRNLIAAAEVLGEKPDEKWLLVSEKLPQACLAPFVKDWGENMPIKVEGEQEIALWDGVCLNGSHRHHSHLAGICPFNTLDPESPEWAAIVRNSIARWVGKGMSGWTGWCVPWASSIQVRLDNPQAANTLLKLWHASFVNPGGCSTHDAVYHGVFQFCGRPDIIQLDGTMGALSAIQDMLLHDRCGVLHLFAGVVCGASFENMPAPGGFVVSASNIPAAGDAGNARVRAVRSGNLRLRLHIPCGRIVCRYDGREMVFAGDDVIELHLEAGSEAVFSAI